MPNYVPDPNDDTKQVPGPTTKFEKAVTQTPHSMSKTPNYVLVTSDLTNTAGFFFGSSASFADKQGDASVTSSTHYTSFGGEATLKAGTMLDIHPLAWSGSVADKEKIIFVYKAGLDGSGRR